MWYYFFDDGAVFVGDSVSLLEVALDYVNDGVVFVDNDIVLIDK